MGRLLGGADSRKTPWTFRYTLLHFVGGSVPEVVFPFAHVQPLRNPRYKWAEHAGEYKKSEAVWHTPKPMTSLLITNFKFSDELPSAFFELTSPTEDTLIIRQRF